MELLLRYIGLPGLAIIALLLFYEGVPVIGRIPFVAETFPSGLLAGRVQTYANEKNSQMVSKFELQSAQAQLLRERQLRQAADDANLAAQVRAQLSDDLAARRQEEINRLAADAASNNLLSRPTEEDLRWLEKH